eukprot:GHVS01048662.1.p1 GENE.GHVS01048662.1~~GHVS01048662.1.p1  ORF type:complete len:334 (-),score=60.68 GHVS01048662.1:43-984(-)
MSSPSCCGAAGVRLRALLSQPGCLCLPGAFNGLVARMIKQTGFSACYLSGAAISASSGLPDVGLVGLEGFCRAIREITLVSGLPCLADGDTGFGEIENVRRTVREYEHSGAAGIHIEDQEFPKRCGHLEGKRLVSVEDMCEKVNAAAEAAKTAGGGMVICARTDAREVEGRVWFLNRKHILLFVGMDSAIERASRYVEAGADMIFPEGLHSKAEFEQFSSAMRSRGNPFMLANMTEFGKTVSLPVSFFAQAGYHAVIFPVSTLRIAMQPVKEMLEMLHKDGTVEPYIDKMFTRQELYDTIRYVPGHEWKFPAV